MCAANAELRRDAPVGIGAAIVVVDGDHRIADATGMIETQHSLSKSLAVPRLDAVLLQPVFPELH